MKLSITNESPDEVKVKLAKEYLCEFCNDTGYISFDESDGDGHMMSGTGTKKCDMCNEPDYEQETDY